MNVNKITQRSLEAVQSAQSIAVSHILRKVSHSALEGIAVVVVLARMQGSKLRANLSKVRIGTFHSFFWHSC